MSQELERGITREKLAPPLDPWQHRSENMRCLTCMYYVEKSDNMGLLGRCRRRAPTMAGFPVVYPTDWCGDHKLAFAP